MLCFQNYVLYMSLARSRVVGNLQWLLDLKPSFDHKFFLKISEFKNCTQTKQKYSFWHQENAIKMSIERERRCCRECQIEHLAGLTIPVTLLNLKSAKSIDILS